MAQSVGFRRNIGLFMAVMIGIGAMMGPGIFALPSVVAGSIWGPPSRWPAVGTRSSVGRCPGRSPF